MYQSAGAQAQVVARRGAAGPSGTTITSSWGQSNMKVLVAGDRGYIGAVLVPLLRAAGHDVDGLDIGLYDGCDLGPFPASQAGPATADIRDVQPGRLTGYDAVICLAALSNDPLGHLSPAATYSINLDGTLALAKAAKQAGVPRFLFASSCSLYGAAGSAGVAEDADDGAGNAVRRDQGAGRARAIAAGRGFIQPDLPAQRDGIRRVAAAAA